MFFPAGYPENHCTKLATEMSHDEFWKSIYFEFKRPNVKVTRHKNSAGVGFCTLCECRLLSVLGYEPTMLRRRLTLRVGWSRVTGGCLPLSSAFLQQYQQMQQTTQVMMAMTRRMRTTMNIQKCFCQIVGRPSRDAGARASGGSPT